MKEEVTHFISPRGTVVGGANPKLLHTEVHGLGHPVGVPRAAKIMQQVRAVTHRLWF